MTDAQMQFKSRYREYGGEQAYWPAGPFKIRLPFIVSLHGLFRRCFRRSLCARPVWELFRY